MIALLIVFVVIRLDLKFPGGDDVADLPLELDRCITQQAVLDFLDGKKVFSDVPTDANADGLETIKMPRKEKISAEDSTRQAWFRRRQVQPRWRRQAASC